MPLDVWHDDGWRHIGRGDTLDLDHEVARGIERLDFDHPVGIGRGGPHGVEPFGWAQARRHEPRGRSGVEYHDLPEQAQGRP